MFKDTITYEDYDGNLREETVYFNLSKAEVLEMELSVNGGYGKVLTNIVEDNDSVRVMNEFTKLIRCAYGKKSPDGKRFIKSKELVDEFIQSEAYSELIFKLISDADYATKFVEGMMPKMQDNQPKTALEIIAEKKNQ